MSSFRLSLLVGLALLASCDSSAPPEVAGTSGDAPKPHAEGQPQTDADHADEHGHGDEDGHSDEQGHADEGGHGDEHGHADEEGHSDEEGHGDESEPDQIHLTDAQIRAAQIEVAPVELGTGGSLVVPAVIAVDPARAAVVATAIGGRIRTLPHQVGEHVDRGDVLAVLESREAAELSAEQATALQQLQLAQSTLRREERLFAERVSPEGDVLAARTAAKEAEIRARLARDRIEATGATASGTSSSVEIRSPLPGHVVSRSADLGAVVAADTELFRVADLSTVAVDIALVPDKAQAVQVGATVHVSTGSRSADGTMAFISPIIDPQTRQVRAMAHLANAEGLWRIGETVEVHIPLGAADGATTLTVPSSALQTVEGKPTVFVRNAEGFRTTHLQIGSTSGGAVVVTSGLNAGDRIAVSNTFVLKAEAGKGEGGHHDH